MNELIKVNGREIETKEYQGERVVTAWDIAKVHGREVREINQQFNKNIDKLIEGEDYFILNRKDFSESFKLIQDFIPNNVKEISLFTESGYLMLNKTFNDDFSWDIQRQLVKTYFKVKSIVSSKLNPLDALKLIVSSLDKQDNRLNLMEGKIEKVKEVMTENTFDWREDTRRKIISMANGKDFKKSYDEIYGKLESDARCDLKRRKENMKKRYEQAGRKISEINKISKLDVIEEDPVLKNMFVKIVNVAYAKANL